MPNVIRDTQAMLVNMTPVLTDGEFVFCTTKDVNADALPLALSWFREDEGVTLILARADARSLGFWDTLPMRRIVLEVFSALDGVGLTAAVAGALAAQGIPCNMVAAFHHDHVFVPAALAERAIAVLKDV
ncbi:MAG TPA: ACT domain-containing protein [Nordella sp.]|nr:ACT domain-containing protein [Nordella sp.]